MIFVGEEPLTDINKDNILTFTAGSFLIYLGVFWNRGIWLHWYPTVSNRANKKNQTKTPTVNVLSAKVRNHWYQRQYPTTPYCIVIILKSGIPKVVWKITFKFWAKNRFLRAFKICRKPEKNRVLREELSSKFC